MTADSDEVTAGAAPTAPVEASALEGFGERLRRARERAGLSQVALAGDAFHPSYLSLLESGRRSPTSAIVNVLASRLGISTQELTGGVDDDMREKLVLCEAAIATGRPADAVSLLGPLVSGLPEQRLVADDVAFRVAQAYATALERTGRLDEATAVGERLRAAAETAPGRLPWLPVVVALVRCYRDAGDLGRAVDLGEAALRRFRELRLEGLDGHAALVSTLAGVYSDRGDHLRAKTILDALIEQTEGQRSTDDRAYALWNSAINAAERGHAGEGLRLAERAAALLSEGEDLRSSARLQVTRAWLMLAQDPPDAAGARRILRTALPRLRESAGTASVASAEIELARCELLLGRQEVARRLARSALRRLTPEQHVRRARALITLGASLVASGETAAGVAELEEAAATLETNDSHRQAAAVWRQLSGVFRSLGDAAWALKAADRAMDAAGLPDEPLVVSRGLGAGASSPSAGSHHSSTV